MPRRNLSDGTEYFYTDRGSGPPVVLAHGWGTCGLVWEDQVAALVAHHRVIVPDWRGCGRSDHPAHGNTIRRIAEDFLELYQQLELQKAVWVGSSIGGNIVLDLATRNPDTAAGVVLIDAPLHWFADGLNPVTFATWTASLRRDRPKIFTDMVRGWFGPTVGADTRRWTVDMLLRSGWFIDDTLKNANTHDLRATLPHLQVPVLFLHGRHDGEVPLHVPEEAARLLPHAQLRVHETAGHMPHLEVPAEVNRAIAGFISEIRSREQRWGDEPLRIPGSSRSNQREVTALCQCCGGRGSP